MRVFEVWKKVNEASFTSEIKDIQFAKSQLTDKHIKQIINMVATKLMMPPKQIEDEIMEKIKEIQEFKKLAPLLYSTMAENAIESEIFNLIKENDITHPSSSRWSKVIFNKLISLIKSEFKEFYPLQTRSKKKSAKEAYICIPDPDEPELTKKWKSIKTAAATPDATFIFNIPFMQQLIDYANLKGVKPTSWKYKSNGGNIPDDYVFIEFLIMHEWMHYTYGDWDYQKVYKVSNKIMNWVGDFRSNYMLVKHGLHQLPIGLFSKDINLDKQWSHSEMIKIVTDEFNKLPKPLQIKAETWLDKQMDHGPKQPKSPPPGIEIGSLVKTPNGDYGVVTKIDPTTKKVSVRDLTAQEKSILQAKLSTMTKI
jgi:hypothetical protein